MAPWLPGTFSGSLGPFVCFLRWAPQTCSPANLLKCVIGTSMWTQQMPLTIWNIMVSVHCSLSMIELFVCWSLDPITSSSVSFQNIQLSDDQVFLKTRRTKKQVGNKQTCCTMVTYSHCKSSCLLLQQPSCMLAVDLSTVPTSVGEERQLLLRQVYDSACMYTIIVAGSVHRSAEEIVCRFLQGACWELLLTSASTWSSCRYLLSRNVQICAHHAQVSYSLSKIKT